MNKYQMLDTGGPGCPGETTRVMTSTFLKRKNLFRSSESIIREILSERGELYNSMGMDILGTNRIDRIVYLSNGDVSFAVLADTIVTNMAQDNLNGIKEHLDLSIEVILDNYNRMVSSHKGIYDKTDFTNRGKKLINDLQYGRF